MIGLITITNKEGGIILSLSVWAMALVLVFGGKGIRAPKDIRIFIDDEEIPRPEEFGDDS